jgi:hypothetical protein
MERTLKTCFRKITKIKIVFILSAFISFMLIFCWDKTSGDTSQSLQTNVFEDKEMEKEYKVNDKIMDEDYKHILNIKDLFISVKTALKFHNTRIKLLLDTWISTCKNQVFKYIQQQRKH